MSPDTQDLLQKALALPDRERAELAGTLIESLDPIFDEDTDAAWQEEIARRAREIESGQVKTIPWSEVRKKGRALLDGE
jgi:putative addiction module component (TIGR02574 family)